LDPITHGVIGLAISSFSGTPVSPENPISIGCMIGAMMPDIDFVIRIFKNDMAYLKHHRGFTHSVPALFILSAGVAALLSLFFGFESFIMTMLWTFIGGLSHTAFDVLNSYGAMIFKKKRKLNILTLYDPVVAAVSLFLIFTKNHSFVANAISVLILAVYLAFKYLNRNLCESKVLEFFSMKHEVVSLRLMPSLKVFYKWDFVISTSTHSIVGNIHSSSFDINITQKFRNTNYETIEIFKNTTLGKYFDDFTPNYHLVPTYNRLDNTVEIKAIDLRYHFRNDFLHHGTIVIDNEKNIVESYFRPYKYTKKISVPETA
jgi:inner membrane protein